ncbi:MAG TPA: hypothetical protein VFW23_02980 [Tepidisphaeraceae bacterium]|nr:hypothetical protein [Tepidisphaeraceae bacterium]
MPAMTANIGADATQMAREFDKVAVLAERAGGRIQRGIAGHGAGGMNTIAMREVFVLMREMSRGNWTRVPGSLSILLSQFGLLKLILRDNVAIAKAEAAALTAVAEKSAVAAAAARAQVETNTAAMASMERVTEGELLAAQADMDRAAAAEASAMADRQKAVAATEAAEAMEAEGGAAAFSLGPVGWLALALIAVGTAAFFAFRHFRDLEETQKNMADLADDSRESFVAQARGMREAATWAENLRNRLNDLGDSQDDLTRKTERHLRVMRERARLEREAAQQSGASKRDLAQMDVNQAREELAYLEQQADAAAKKADADKKDADAMVNYTEQYERRHAGRLGEVQKQSATLGEVVEAIKEKMKEGVTETRTRFSAGIGLREDYKRPATDTDRIKVNVGGKDFNYSLNEATKLFNEMTNEEDLLLRTEKLLKDLSDKKVALTKKEIDEKERLQGQADELREDLRLKQEFFGVGNDKKHSHMHGHVSNLQQVGAYTPLVAHLDVARQQLAVQHKLLSVIEHNLGPVFQAMGFGKSFSDVFY